MENGRHLRFGGGRNNLGIEETAYGLSEVADFDEEAVVTELRVEFEAGDRFSGIQECACDAAGFVRREKPVGTQVHIQEFGLHVFEGVFKGTVFGFEIEAVGSMCDVQVAIGVETVHEFGALVTQVAFQRKIQVERRAVGDRVITVFLVLGALELLFHAHGAEVSNVGELAGVGKTNVRVGGFVVVAAVKIRVLGNHVAGDDFKTESLAAESRRTCDHDAAAYQFRVVDGPFHGLETTHGATDDAAELVNAEALCQFALGVHHVADSDHGEGAAVGLARAGVDGCGASGAFAATQNVTAHDKELVGIYRFAGANQGVPPTGFLVVFGIVAGNVGVCCKRRTHPDNIALVGVQRSVRFVTDFERRKGLATFELKTLVPVILREGLGHYRADAVFMQKFTHMHKYSLFQHNRKRSVVG